MNDDLNLEFIVPGPAGTINWKFKGPVQKRNYKKYKQRVAVAASQAIAGREVFEIITEDVQVTVYYFHTPQERRDIDNVLKPILDGLGGEEDDPVLWDDDEIVARIIAERFDSVDIQVQDPPLLVAEALRVHQNFVYVKVEGTWR